MDKELQQQIITLIQKAQQGDKEAISQLQQIMEAAKKGDPKAVQIAQLIQQTAKQLQGAQMARFGAKLNYIRHLNGQCPMGYEIEYFKAGGRVGKRCKKCQKAQQGMEAPTNTLEAFKCGRKMKKKACGGTVKEAKCGTKVSKKEIGGNMAPDARIRYKGGTYSRETPWQETVTAPDGSLLNRPSKIVRTIHTNFGAPNDTTVYEIPSHNRFIPVNEGRKATTADKNRTEFNILNRRFDQGKSVSR